MGHIFFGGGYDFFILKIVYKDKMEIRNHCIIISLAL